MKATREEMFQIIKGLSLCLDEYGVPQSTHHITNGKIEPNGSFIALVERANDVVNAEEE